MQKLNLKNILVSILLLAIFGSGTVLALEIPKTDAFKNQATAAAANIAAGAVNSVKAAALAQSQAVVAEKLAAVNELKSSLDSLKKIAATTQTALDSAQSEFTTAQKNYETATLKLKSATTVDEKDAAQKEVDVTKAEMQTKNTNLTVAKTKKTAADEKVATKETEVTTAEKDLETSESELAAATSSGKFEVTLQTPFSKSPDQFETPLECSKEEEGYYNDGKLEETGKPDENGNIWFCAKGSVRWQQVISGDDGNDILENYAALIYKWLSGFIGIVAVLMLVVGGIQISTAGANQEGLQGGKDRIVAALLGLVLLFLASLILYTINPGFFGQDVEVGYVSTPTPATTTTTTPATTTTTVPTTTTTTVPVLVSGDEYSHDEAVAKLKGAGFTIWSSAGSSGICADRDTCKTSFQEIKKTTIDGVIALKGLSKVSTLQINGGSEKTGHSATSKHYVGLAVDIQKNQNGDSLFDWVKTQNPTVTDSPEGKVYGFSEGGFSFKFLVEGNHYHLSVNS